MGFQLLADGLLLAEVVEALLGVAVRLAQLVAIDEAGGAPTLDKFNPKTTLNGLHIRFLPDSAADAQLNSKDMLQKATFMWAEDLKRESAEGRPTESGESNGGSEPGSGD